MDSSEIIAAVIASAPAWGVLYYSVRIKRTADDTHRQVVTLNEKTIGELAAATETRRAESISHDDRTAAEQRHIDTAPPDDPPQGPRR